MIAFTDVHYDDDSARAACVVAAGWADAEPLRAITVRVTPIAAYEPGAFYKRELPCLLAVLAASPKVTHVVIDGYVWLDAEHTPGLGAHLHAALGGAVPVIGLAKTAYRGSEMALRLERPGSVKPLFLTSIGIAPAEALAHVKQLHGPYRLPTLLKWVDQLSRGERQPSS
jgi:deoxyribonuclease V